MPNNPNYACTNCQRPTKRDDLTVKKSLFVEMGAGSRTVRSRVVAWLCNSCLIQDVDFRREKFSPPRVVNELAV